MGIDRTDYVMLAVKLTFDDIASNDDIYNEYLNKYEDNGHSRNIVEHKGLTMVSDGMNGEYAFIGKVLSKAIEFEGLPITDCSSKKDAEKIKSLITDQFGIPSPKVKIWAFSHWH